MIGLRNGCQPLEGDQIVMSHINYWTATYQFCLLEPRVLKGARVVPRGERTSNGPDLPDDREIKKLMSKFVHNNTMRMFLKI